MQGRSMLRPCDPDQPGEWHAPLAVPVTGFPNAELWFGLALLVFVCHDVTPLSIKNTSHQYIYTILILLIKLYRMSGDCIIVSSQSQ